MSKGGQRQTAKVEVQALDQQLVRLDELMQENNKLYEHQLKNEFDHYEEQKKLIESMRTKARFSSPESMTRLRSAKRKLHANSPIQKQPRLGSMNTMKLGEEHKSTRLPAFGPFKQKKSNFNAQKQSANPLNFNDRKMVASGSMKWTDQFSPDGRGKTTILQLNNENQRRVETALGHRPAIDDSFQGQTPQTAGAKKRVTGLEVTGNTMENPNRYRFLRKDYQLG